MIPLAMLPAMIVLSTFIDRCRAAEMGDLFVQTEPEGLAVWVDGVETGLRTPVLLRGLAVGTHELRVREGCVGAVTEVVVEPDRIARAELRTGVVVGRVEIATDLPLFITRSEGSMTGDGRLTLPCGSRTVVVSAEGHQDLVIPVEVPPWEVVRRTVTLEPIREGTLVVAPTPLEAQVWLDGGRVAKGPTTVEGLAPGEHDLRLEAPGHLDWSQPVEIRAGEVLRVEAVLQERPPPKTTWARWLLDGVVTGGALAAGGLCVWQYAESQAAYQTYLDVPKNETAEIIWAEDVVPAQERALVAGIGAGVLGVGSAVLWATSFRW